MLGPVTSQMRSSCRARSRWRQSRRLCRAASAASTVGWRPPRISNAVPSSTSGAPIALGRELGERGGEIEGGERGGGGGDLGAPRHDLADEIVEEAQFERQRPLGGARDLAFELGELGRRIALRPGHRLAMDELGAELAGVRLADTSM